MLKLTGESVVIEGFTDMLDAGAPIDVMADIRFLPTSQGGKERPVRGKYRPNHNFGPPDNRVFYIGEVEFSADDVVAPGDSRRVRIRFLSGSGLRQLLSAGREWRVQEGSKIVAFARVVEVLADPSQSDGRQ